MRSRGFLLPWRLTALLGITLVSLLWICGHLLVVTWSCHSAFEVAGLQQQAEDAQQRAAELQKLVDDLQGRVPTAGNGRAGPAGGGAAAPAPAPDFQSKLVQSLREELQELRRQNAALQGELGSARQHAGAAPALPPAGVAAAAAAPAARPPASTAVQVAAAQGGAAGNERKPCMPRYAGDDDPGYAEGFRGWYDVQGCGRCHDYCRWVGDCGPGGDPALELQHDCSWWSCRLAGTTSAFTPKGHFATWTASRCNGEGDPAPAPAPPVQATAVTGRAVGGGTELKGSEDLLRAAASRGAVAVVVISCKRPQYLQRAMASLLKATRDPEHFPVIISQDAFDAAMTQMVDSTYVAPGTAFHMHHPHDNDAPNIAKRFGGSKAALGYVRIAQHYGFAMRRVFDDFGFQQAIFLEEDMEISLDFFSYFTAMLPMLRSDPDLFCVSAWNDNGYANLVSDEKEAFRTDFFPGLGWMLVKSMWEEVRDRWAVAYWDEFMRRGDVRRGRHCIRPEISRSYTFGQEGTSGGQFFKTHLSKIRLSDQPVDWPAQDLSRLASAAAFDSHLVLKLRAATKVDLNSLDPQLRGGGASSEQAFRIEYDDARDYKGVAAKFGLMPDEKEGVRRMSYRGVIPFTWQGRRVYLYTKKWPGNVD